jgi:hypothetical protein
MGLLDSILSKKTRESSELASRLPIVVTERNGTAFVSGLYWVTLDKVQDYMREARRRAKEPEMAGMAIVAIRERKVTEVQVSVQAGFAPDKSDGAGKGQYSMASVIAGQLGDHFVAALDRGDGQYVVIACSRGAIVFDRVLPAGEVETVVRRQINRVTQASEQATQQSGSEKAFAGAKLRLYVPQSLGLDDSEECALDDLLGSRGLRKEYKLRQLAFGGLSQKELTRYTVLSLVTVVVIVGGAYAWHVFQKRAQDIANAKARADAIEAAKRRAGVESAKANTAAPTLPHPWLNRPSVSDFVQICEAQYAHLAIAIAGFDLIEADCTMGNLKAYYVRDPNSVYTLNDFKSEVKRIYGVLPEPVYGQDGNEAHIDVGYKIPPFKVHDDTPPLEVNAVWDLISYFQKQAGAVEEHRLPDPKASAAPGDSAAKATPIQDWSTYEWSIPNSPNPPELVLGGFDMPTARLSTLTEKRDPKTARTAFTIQGELYVH